MYLKSEVIQKLLSTIIMLNSQQYWLTLEIISILSETPSNKFKKSLF